MKSLSVLIAATVALFLTAVPASAQEESWIDRIKFDTRQRLELHHRIDPRWSGDVCIFLGRSSRITPVAILAGDRQCSVGVFNTCLLGWRVAALT